MGHRESVGAHALALFDALLPAETAPLLYLAPSDALAEALAAFVGAAMPASGAVHLPAWHCLPYDWASPSAGVSGRRLRTLSVMAEGRTRLVVTSPEALVQRLPPKGAASPRMLRIGDALDADAFVAEARCAGYLLRDRVDEPGEIARQGLILDLFPAGIERPCRIRVEDGAIAAISPFDPQTQHSDGDEDSVVMDAATELPSADPHVDPHGRGGADHWLPDRYPALSTLVDHLPGARLISTAAALARAEAHLEALPAAHAERVDAELRDGDPRRSLPPDRLYLTKPEWTALCETARTIEIRPVAAVPAIHAAARPRRKLADAMAHARRTVLIAATARDIARMARMCPKARRLQEAGAWSDLAMLPEGAVGLLRAPLARGFAADGLLVLTARDVLGHGAGRPHRATATLPGLHDMRALRLGDLVVHGEIGIGRFDGLEEMHGGEAIRIVFAGEKAVLVPPADAGKLWRYGHDEGGVALDAVGGKRWRKQRARLAREVDALAAKSTASATSRRNLTVPKLIAADAAHDRVVAGFDWEETPDQLAAIDAVLADLASGRPMNRILIGDVGYGKTEVAVRAIAAAASAGAQVALIAPTTVLASQHAATLARRMAPTGIEVAALSRLTAPSEARRIRAGLADGGLRIVVGTHAVLSRATRFSELGLVVIDEEQRFGRAHKEALRKLARGVHVLSMTATPIPGSLQQALAGLQDLSLLATAPLRRRPIRTILGRATDNVLRDVLLREWRRGGQSFVVVPRVEEIDATVARIAADLPALRIRVAHGALPARRIDAEMTAFARGDGDVLEATAIIESGLDVPRANAIVILRPDLLGLAQMHQLRGRVGRGGRQAHCWLLTDPQTDLSDAARRRLETLTELDTLGSGFMLSQVDLDDRGAGDLLGDGQSGHAARVGPALQADLLAAALHAARGTPDVPPPEVHVEAEAGLPEAYVPSADARATLYVRIGHVGTVRDAERLADEIEDRFGPPPPEAAALLSIMAIRAHGREIAATGISAGPKGVAVDLAEGRAAPALPPDVERVDGRIVLHRDLPEASDRLGAALELIDRLAS